VAARAALLTTGLYGPRITVDHLDLAMMPYSSYFANLIVDSLEPVGVPKDVARHLKPIGGKFCFKACQKRCLAGRDEAERRESQDRERGRLERAHACHFARRDSWSHQYGNAANTSSTDDAASKAD
jgi:hypothetical protein